MEIITLIKGGESHHINLAQITCVIEKPERGLIWICFSDADNDYEFTAKEAAPLLEAIGFHHWHMPL